MLLVYPQTGTRPFQEQYLTLMAIHLPLLAWAGVGVYLLWRRRDAENRFAFLIKSLEVGIMGGLLLIAGGLFTAITISLFQALNVVVPELVQRLLLAGGAGLIPVVATAVIYNPRRAPARQSFDEGLSKLVAMLMRILLPLTLLVLVVYLAVHPVQLPRAVRQPGRADHLQHHALRGDRLAGGRDAACRLADLSPALARWLRRGIIAVAALALLVSLYALRGDPLPHGRSTG